METADEKTSGGWRDKKREYCRDYQRRRRKELLFVRERALLVYNELVRMGVYPQLSDEAKEFFDVYVHREKMDMYPYPPTLYKMFGKAIAPGVSCTLKEAMQRLYKGKNEINYLVKKWVEKHGVRISIEPSESGVALDTKYIITRLEPRESAHIDDVRELMGENEARDYRDYKSRG